MCTVNAATYKKGLHKQRLPVFVGLSLLISLCLTVRETRAENSCTVQYCML